MRAAAEVQTLLGCDITPAASQALALCETAKGIYFMVKNGHLAISHSFTAKNEQFTQYELVTILCPLF